MNSAAAESEPGTFLPWDTDFFGFRIGRANATQLNPQSLAALLAWTETLHLRCLYFSADGQSGETLELASRSGFQFVDVRVDLTLPMKTAAAPAARDENIRTARPGDMAGLQTIARRSHLDTRFFKDRGFPIARAEALYAEWIRRDMEKHHVLVAEDRGEAAGYITCLTDPATGHGRIGLIAVAGPAQGKGLGRALLLAGLDWFRTMQCELVRVATQAANLPAQRLYQAAGFRSTESSVWFHRWSPVPPTRS